MRDVLGGLEESATYFAYRPGCDDMEILSIEAPGPDPHRHRTAAASIHSLPDQSRSSDIVSYLLRRESAA